MTIYVVNHKRPLATIQESLNKLNYPSANVEQFIRLLELIHAPEDLAGLHNAVWQLQHSARFALALAPKNANLNELVNITHAFCADIRLKAGRSNQDMNFVSYRPNEDRNEMAGRYDEYPLYSLFTQEGRFIERHVFARGFNQATGILLANVWLSNTVWHPVPGEFAELVTQLRNIRREKQFNKLFSIIDSSRNLQGLIDKLAAEPKRNVLASSLCDLSLKLHELTSGPYKPQPDVPATRSEIEPEEPPPEKKTDLGDKDYWQFGKARKIRPVATGRPPTLKPTSFILRAPTPHQPGVDTSETDITASFVEAHRTASTEKLPDLGTQKFQVLDARFANELDNQFLRYSWEVLNESEVATLVDAIKVKICDPSESRHTRIGALITGLAIVTSRSPEELAAFKVATTATKEMLVYPTIILDTACWYAPFPTLDRFEPTPDQSFWLKPVGNGCFLPLPREFLSMLSAEITSNYTLGSFLHCDAKQFDYLANEFCKTVRKDAKSRVNVSWLRSIMFHRMLALSQDDVGSIATLGSTEQAPTVGLYYATFGPDKWRDIYCQSISSLNLTPSTIEDASQLPYGSRQYPEENKLLEWISNFSQIVTTQCKQARSLAEIISCHNLYSSYTFLMLLASTSHRPADVITFCPTSIDLENAWIIISDKITSPTTRVRLIPLPEIVLKQLKSYNSHLRNLSPRLYPANAELAAKVALLADSQPHSLIPYLFWLNDDLSSSPIDISIFKDRFNWPFEGNAFRHFMATGLRTEHVSAEYIAILLGHVQNGQYGFGKFSALSPTTWKESIASAISKVLERQGWQHIAGLTHLRKSLPDQEFELRKLRKIPAIDYFAKAMTHVELTRNDRQIVRSAFYAAKNDTSPDSPSDVFLAAFRNEIIKQSIDSPDRLARRLNFHVRFVRLHRHALNPSSIPGWAADMQVEDAAVEPDTLSLASIANHYRELIPDVSRSFDELNHHERVALIMISSILFGGLLRESLVKLIPELLATSLRHFDEYLWIDFEDSSSGGCQRWFPDPVTALLIVRFVNLEEACLPVHSGHLRTAIANLLVKVMPTKFPIESVGSLAELIRASKAYFTLRIPGLLRAYACGEVRSVSLAEGAWLRLISGHPLCGELLPEAPRERNVICPHPRGEGEVFSRKIYKEILQSIRNEFPASNSGATNRKGERKNHLAALSRSLLKIAADNEQMPSVVFAILSWADHLANEGSVVVRAPSTGTIYDYITDISSALIEFGSEVDFLELSDAELTDIYQRAIDFGNANSRPSRARSLRWFHEFCEDEFDLPEIDWDEIAPGLTSFKSNVSANLVTFEEYQHAKQLLSGHPLLDIRERQMYVIALILIYRCGLRLGELLRLTVSDLVLNVRNILLVRNGIYGKTKSRAGIRQIPWLDRLDNDELTRLNDWIEHRKTITKQDPWGALFGEAEEARTLEVRVRISRVLAGALRAVTGDDSVKVHHLRHGVGTSAISVALSMVQPSITAKNGARWFNTVSNEISAEFRMFHLGQPTPTRRIVWAISQALGHSSPRTTIWHYGHSLDLSLHDHVSQLVSLRNVDVSHLSGMSQNQLNVTSHKNPETAPAALALNWLLKNSDGLKPHIRLSDQPFSASNQPLSPPIQYLCSPKLAHIILTDLANGFPIAQIANRYAREEVEIRAINESARTIERKTGYRVYRPSIGHNESSKADLLIQSRNSGASRLITGHASMLIPQFRAALENPKAEKILDEGIGVWIQNFSRNHSGLRIPYPEDIKTIENLLIFLGFENSQLILASNSLERLIEISKDGKLKIHDDNFIQRANNYRSTKREPLGTTHAPTLLTSFTSTKLRDSARHSKGGASISMKKLHHVFFLSSVLMLYRRILKSGKVESSEAMT